MYDLLIQASKEFWDKHKDEVFPTTTSLGPQVGDFIRSDKFTDAMITAVVHTPKGLEVWIVEVTPEDFLMIVSGAG